MLRAGLAAGLAVAVAGAGSNVLVFMCAGRVPFARARQPARLVS